MGLGGLSAVVGGLQRPRGGVGLSFDAIEVPVQLSHGRNDKFVPFQHGEWLSRRIPGVEAHLSEDDGHLTLLFKLREIHAWLLEHV